ncbi:MAG: acyl-CoA dehydrogenase family protein [Pirellulales bacterium]
MSNTTFNNHFASSISATLSAIEPVRARLDELAAAVDLQAKWPTDSIQACVDGGVLRWFLPEEFGGWNWSDSQILLGYLGLSQSCLTTAFILTQWHAATRRILNSNNLDLRQDIASKLADGSCFVTVGISQLSTSRQHTAPALAATPVGKNNTPEEYILNGYAPWVTGAEIADELILGATLTDGRQIVAAVPRKADGVTCLPGMQLVALTSSCTDRVELKQVRIGSERVVAGPIENVLLTGSGRGGGVGGLHTSILAVGHSMRVAQFLRDESVDRSSLRPVADKMSADVEVLRMYLQRMMAGQEPISLTELRRKANSLVLRVTQAALQAAKGAGFIDGHPAGRWAREALFFLVWSCPQVVVEANLCDLAGIETPE